MEKLKKYLFKNTDVAKQSRESDPTQLVSLSHDITWYPHVIPADLCPRIEQGSGSCIFTVCSLAHSTSNILGWCEGMSEHLSLFKGFWIHAVFF